MSAGDPRLHFGLGPATRADRPDRGALALRPASTSTGASRPTNGYRLKEGDPTPRPLIGFEHTLRGCAAAPAAGTSRAAELGRPLITRV